MEKQILSDKEIDSILQFNRDRKDGIRLVDLYHALKEEFGLYEAEKSILSIMDKSIVLTEYEKKRAMLEERTCMTAGDVKNNPEELRCPNCGCKSIVFYVYCCYLRKSDSDCTPAKGQRLSALSVDFGEEYNYCLGCGSRFNDRGYGIEEKELQIPEVRVGVYEKRK